MAINAIKFVVWSMHIHKNILYDKAKVPVVEVEENYWVAELSCY